MENTDPNKMADSIVRTGMTVMKLDVDEILQSLPGAASTNATLRGLLEMAWMSGATHGFQYTHKLLEEAGRG